MIFQLLGLALVGHLPGAILYRLPLGDRPRRAALPAEERAFWAVILSVALSSVVALGLAAFGQYTFSRLLLLNGAGCVALVVAARGRLWYRGEAPRPGPAALVPVGLVVLGLWLYFPPSEYIIGGRDPGTYMNEGIQVAQRGSLLIPDPLVATVPAQARELFFPPRESGIYTFDRFLGFFVHDFDRGLVAPQFPHLYPAWLAIGYGLDGLTGARRMPGAWAILGLVAVYFAGRRLLGTVAAGAAAALLGLHVLQVWFARLPNTDIALQALAFAALLAYTRADTDRDRFFWPVAGTLLGLVLFLRIEAILVVAACVAAALLRPADRRLPAVFLIPLLLGGALAAWYLLAITTPYVTFFVGFLWAWAELNPWVAAAAVLAAAALGAALGRPSVAGRLRVWLPPALVVGVLAAAGYAYFLREPGGRLAPHDAYALRNFTAVYLTPYALVAALVGYAVVTWRLLWRAPALVLTITVFALTFFYKIRIATDHFWMGRRFLPVILPGMLLFAAAAALWPVVQTRLKPRTTGESGVGAFRLVDVVLPRVWLAAGIVFVCLLAWHYFDTTRRVEPHVEYAGVIPQLERLASRFTDEDLIIVESRNASDLHVLAVPLAYIYARQVLVLRATQPDKGRLAEFLTWARTKFDDVFFLGSGGTDLVSRAIGASIVDSIQFDVPEFERPIGRFPREVRRKAFDLAIYRFVQPRADPGWFALDVGTMDELHVFRFHAKERLGSRETTFRWTRDASYITVLLAPESRVLTVWLSNGGRPAAAPAARVTVAVEGREVGAVAVDATFQPYTFSLPPELVAGVTADDGAARVALRTDTWNPAELLESGDDRELGVMVDRVEVR